MMKDNDFKKIEKTLVTANAFQLNKLRVVIDRIQEGTYRE